MTEWDAEQYSLFAAERLLPNDDLIAAIAAATAAPRRIVDLGCGAGDCSTAALRRRYPEAQIVALDRSAQLIEEACRTEPAADVEWHTGEIETFEPAEPPELIFMGSSFQWVPDHERQLPRLMAMLPRGGTLAIQMPNMFQRPFYTSILDAAQAGPWRDALHGKLRQAPVRSIETYRDLLAPLAGDARIWTKTYRLTFANVDGLVEWAKGAPLRPVGSTLDSVAFSAFCCDYAARLARHYASEGGTCMLPFERLFIVAVR
jgi:trans-aconitate 2-methyltransferase